MYIFARYSKSYGFIHVVTLKIQSHKIPLLNFKVFERKNMQMLKVRKIYLENHFHANFLMDFNSTTSL